ncbi:hypothetical protein AN478_12560 [Thiohalorhabdus denitrificans]|uniref:DUF3501 family protein n=1 Tax=Thiohalorhabdus denitrificans TaxID=381306 RepID=A0A0P9C7D7_9GAMM|nr:DUF3501 family protein [Thiohalorhabdus denitrificans]KPV39122.1 hypothetical protein AN478_12560 [Thiohalorhabdus denitrificans]SCX77092.1 Protein of unknown function [Thiohalorhabdus denitrificans]
MQAITQQDLLSLEDYERRRKEIQERIQAHKVERRLDLDDHISLFFEDRDTMWYQVQEMARAERLYKPEELKDELDVYNPLIPDGSNLKATMMIQYDAREERMARLAELVGIEHRVWVRVDGHDKVYAHADEDLDRSTEDKTSTVHFMRFELDPDMIHAWKGGSPVHAGTDHDKRQLEVTVPERLHEKLANDFD